MRSRAVGKLDKMLLEAESNRYSSCVSASRTSAMRLFSKRQTRQSQFDPVIIGALRGLRSFLPPACSETRARAERVSCYGGARERRDLLCVVGVSASTKRGPRQAPGPVEMRL